MSKLSDNHINIIKSIYHMVQSLDDKTIKIISFLQHLYDLILSLPAEISLNISLQKNNIHCIMNKWYGKRKFTQRMYIKVSIVYIY